MTLADSNLLIDAADPNNREVRGRRLSALPAVSGVSRVETLGFHSRTASEEAEPFVLFARPVALPIDRAVEDEAIRFRRLWRIKLGDALVAATAVVHGPALATRNLRDFAGLPGLTAFDPS
jgi:hypothetical protein